jgi:hypothetical protein
MTGARIEPKTLERKVAVVQFVQANTTLHLRKNGFILCNFSA